MPTSVLSGLRLHKLFLAAGSAMLISSAGIAATSVVPGSAAADRFEDVGGGWQAYVNERFGTRLVFPSVFTPAEAPENGDGQRFQSEDATLEVYAWENVDGESAQSLKRRLLGTQGYTDVTYSPAGRN